MILYAFFSGKKEGIYLIVIKGLPPGNNIEKPYHLWGWLAASVLGVFATLIQTQLKAQILAAILSAVLYWVVYEIAFNKPVFGRTFYIGKTAAIDKVLWKLFGRNAEKWVAVVKLLVIAILNLLYLLL
jgi:disulfide bond formation protein DsbB